MLYLKAISEVREARRQLADAQHPLRSKAISKAYEVISELDGSSEYGSGRRTFRRASALCTGYCLVRLLDANLSPGG